jgi:hypothetical protein
MVRILRSNEEGSTVFALSGRIEESDLPELQSIVDGETGTGELTIDLQEVRIVYREALMFLSACESKGIKLKNCPRYLTEWLRTDRVSSHEP